MRSSRHQVNVFDPPNNEEGFSFARRSQWISIDFGTRISANSRKELGDRGLSLLIRYAFSNLLIRSSPSGACRNSRLYSPHSPHDPPYFIVSPLPLIVKLLYLGAASTSSATKRPEVTDVLPPATLWLAGVFLPAQVLHSAPSAMSSPVAPARSICTVSRDFESGGQLANYFQFGCLWVSRSSG